MYGNEYASSDNRLSIELIAGDLLHFVSFSFWLVFFILAVVAGLEFRKQFLGEEKSTSPRFWIIVTFISIITITSWLTTVWKADNFVLAFAFAMGFVLSWTRPINALIFLITALFLRPWELFPNDYILTSLPKTLAGLAALSWLFHSIRRRRFFFQWNTSCSTLFLFSGWLFLCVFHSPDMLDAQASFFDTFSKSIIVFLLTFNIIETDQDISLLLVSLLITFLGLASMSIYTTYTTGQDITRLRLYGLLADPNDLTAILIMGVPVAMHFLFSKQQNILLRSLGAVFLTASAFTLNSAKSRGAIVALLGYFAVAAFLKIKNKKRAIVMAVVILCLFIPVVSGFKRNVDDLEGSTSSRINYWHTAMRMAVRNPVFGVGYKGFPLRFEAYAPTMLFEWGYRTAHSTWFLILAETGFVGFGLFCLCYFFIFKQGLYIRKEYPYVFFSFFAYSIAMSFLSHSYSLYPYLIFSIVLATAKVLESRKDTSPKKKRLFFKAKKVSLLALALCFYIVPAAHATPLTPPSFLHIWPGIQKEIPATANPGTIIYGSRGEILDFTVQILTNECTSVKIDIPKTLSVHLYRMMTITTENPSYHNARVGKHFDPLMPVDGKVLCPDYSADNFKAKSIVLFGEIEISNNTSPGTYKAKFKTKNLDDVLNVKVWKMQIPNKPALPAYTEWNPWLGQLAHFGKWDDAAERLTRMYFAEMQRHRLYPIKSWVTPFSMQKESDQLDFENISSISYANLFLRTLPTFVYLDFPPTTAGIAPDKYLPALEKSIQEYNIKNRSMVYLWDEPTIKEMPQVITLAKHVRKLAPSLKILVTTPPRDDLDSLVDIYVPIMNEFDQPGFPSPERYRILQKKGKEVWWYVSCLSHGCDSDNDTGTPDFSIERSPSYIRSISWIAHKYDINGFLYYTTNYAWQFAKSKNPWTDLWYFTGNGDGTLFYPGTPGKFGLKDHTPVSSLRLKAWRESSYDAEYLKWLERLPVKPSWWDAAFHRLVTDTTKWSRHYEDYILLHNQLGEYLNEKL